MKPVTQQYHHDPEAGIQGDCLRASIASILELPIQFVPHFVQPDGPGTARASIGNAWRGVDDFLATHELRLFRIPFDCPTVHDVLSTVGQLNGHAYWLLSGSSRVGNHMVVCCGMRIVHDPSPELRDPILVGPMRSGLWIAAILARR